MISGNLSIMYGLKMTNTAIVTACSTGTHCISAAGRMIQYGEADVMIAGGAEMATSKTGLGGFAAARALSTRNDDPQAASRPGIKTVMALCWVMVPVCWFWKNTSMRLNVGRLFMPNSSAPG